MWSRNTFNGLVFFYNIIIHTNHFLFSFFYSNKIVLNSLSIDPGYVWKGNWRFFDENTLRTCDKRKPKDKPLENVIEEGITFEEFLYLAECNGASIIPYLASNTTLAQFRSAILAACTRRLDDIRLVCSYNRSILKQTGTGHFSPIAGYHVEQDLILILDVARFKYPPHWIPIELLWQSMNTIDPSTGKTRGFYLVAKWPSDFSVQCSITTCETSNESTTNRNSSLCRSEESLLLFINQYLLPYHFNPSNSIQSIVLNIFESLTSNVVQLTTKWTFDLMQKYRLNAVINAKCAEECKCVNLFESYSSFLPENINQSLEDDQAECKKPCARVTRSHVHAYAMPTRCVLTTFIELFDNDVNRKLYDIIGEIDLKSYLIVNKNKPMYLFGGFSAMIDDNDMFERIERGLTTVFLYALRTDDFLANIDVFNSNELSQELKTEIQYAKACFGL